MMDDNNNHKFELLKMARELLNEEYINRRAEDHNRWVAESDLAWKTRRIKLPYPPFAPYPTETEIVAKAATLYSFLSTSKPAVEAAKPAVDQVEPVNLVAPVEAAPPVVSNGMSAAVESAMEISKKSIWDTQLPNVVTEPVGERVKAVEHIVETKVDLVPKPNDVLPPLVTTVVTETNVGEPLVTNTRMIESVTLEPKPLFAVPSWLQKIQK